MIELIDDNETEILLRKRIKELQQENQQLKEQLELNDFKTTYNQYVERCEKYKSVLDEIRNNLQKSIDSINNKLSDKKIRFENGILVNPIKDYRLVRLKAIRMKCKELLQILDKVRE